MSISNVQAGVWAGRLPLEIRLAPSESRTFDQTDPYLISLPRLSYLPLLLPRLHAFFGPNLITDSSTIDPSTGFFTHDSVILKWHLPLGLLYDIYAISSATSDSNVPSLPFKLTLHFDHTNTDLVDPQPIILHDSFVNSIKEADFLRSGTARPIMSLPANDSKLLWSSTQSNDMHTWSRIHTSLFPAQGQWRNVPLRIYIPSSLKSSPDEAVSDDHPKQPTAQIKVLQSPLPPVLKTTATSTSRPGAGTQPQTLGTALHALMPSLFPSRRTPILARPILHGAQVPMSAHLEDLARSACYADGWLNVVVVLNS